MATTRKNLTPKHVLLSHSQPGEPSSPVLQGWRKWSPLSPRWLRIISFGYHSPTWATALALSTLLSSENVSRRPSLQSSVHMSHISDEKHAPTES
jgi:hypothetical protein